MQLRLLNVAVDGGDLRVLQWGTGKRVAVAVHGITASGMSWQAVARHMPPDWSLAAPDLQSEKDKFAWKTLLDAEKFGPDSASASSLFAKPVPYVSRIFERGGRFRTEVDSPENEEAPGRPIRTLVSPRIAHVVAHERCVRKLRCHPPQDWLQPVG